jgi:hypothetical protein
LSVRIGARRWPHAAITDTFTKAVFGISVLSEPPSAPGAGVVFLAELEDKPRFLCFLFLVLEAVNCGRCGRCQS